MAQRSFHEHIYRWHEEVENLEGYGPGGYHPVNIGEVYSDGRYRVVHKLGWGGYSTVWLAHDLQSNRYVALKIVVAEASQDSTENRVWRQLSHRIKEGYGGTNFVASLLDDFYINGPNGRHLCLVTEPNRVSVKGSKEEYHPWMFSLQIARAIAAQAILGLQAIHRSGFVHGDLHLRNILFALPQIDSMSVDDIYRNFHTPRETKIHRVDGAPLGPEVPEYSVMPAQTLIVCDEVSDPRICISDFGEAWLSTDTPPEDLHTPLPYLPPETTFARDQFGFPADVWTLACSVYEIMGERMLYEVYFGDRDDVLAEMVSCLGPLPQHWRDAWQAWGKFFQEDGSWRTDMTRHDSKSRPLHQRVFHDMGRENDPEFSIAEAESLERMLRAMFQYEPAKRATIDDVVKSDWMTHWGLPSLQTYNIQPHKPQDTLLSQRSVTEAGNVRASPTAGVTRP